MKKLISAILSAALLLSLTACGDKSSVGGEIKVNSNTVGNTVSSDAPMGRWVETKLSFGEDMYIYSITALENGTLLCYASQSDGDNPESIVPYKCTSKDDGATWDVQKADFADKLGGYVIHMAVSPKGAAIATVRSTQGGSGQEHYDELFYISEGQEPVKLENKWVNGQMSLAFVSEDVFYGESIGNVAFTDKDGKTITTQQANAVYSTKTGEKLADCSGELDVLYTGTAIQASTCSGDKLLIASYDGKLIAMDEGGVLSDIGTLELKDATVKLATDADENIYYITKEGIGRQAQGGSIAENIVQNPTFAFSAQNNYNNLFARNKSGDFYVASYDTSDGQNRNHSLYRYHFDTTLPAISLSTFTVWSLYEQGTVRAAISAFAKANGGAAPEYIVALPNHNKYIPADKAAIDDKIKALNTELLAGKGPDVIIFDGIDYAPYINKAVLLDIKEAVPQDKLAPHIKAEYCTDKINIMPMRFSIPMIFGDDSIQSIKTIDDVTNAVLSGAVRPDAAADSPDYYTKLEGDDKYAFTFTSSEDILNFLLLGEANALITKDGLNAELLTNIYTNGKKIYDYYQMDTYNEKQEKNGIASGVGGEDTAEMSYTLDEYFNGRARYGYESITATSVLGMLASFKDDLAPAVLQPGHTEGAYMPLLLTGVNAATQKKAEALSFIKAMLSDEVQNAFFSDGIAVTQGGINAANERNITASTKYKGDVNELINKLKTPININTVAQEKLQAVFKKYCKGELTIDKATSEAQQSLAMYFAEQR
ncbi:MAG: extracellular solute-binding protein [Oscillospiraceae bacterium]